MIIRRRREAIRIRNIKIAKHKKMVAAKRAEAIRQAKIQRARQV